jgi:hypothetical protein
MCLNNYGGWMLDNNKQETTAMTTAGVVVRFLVLFALCVWVFRPEFIRMTSKLFTSSEKVHVPVIAIAILLLIYFRRGALLEGLTKGSAWGILLLFFGFLQFAGATWPFTYGYICDLAMLPVLAGVILIAGGWRSLKLSFPMLLLVLLAIPIGSRLYASLILRPETYTIGGTSVILQQLFGIDTWINGTDLFFSLKSRTGVIALGQSHRGVRLILAFATIGVFVTFSQIRSLGRVAMVAVMGLAVLFLCNFLRFFCWALVVIYGGFGPESGLPRIISSVFSLVVCYGLFLFLSSFSVNPFVEDEDDNNVQETANV